DYNEIRLKGKYTGEGLKRKVLELYEDGTSLRAIDIQNDPKNKKYHRAVIRRYDSWYDFLEEIGIDSSEWISRIDWKNGETVIEVMNGMFSEGIVTGVSTKDIKLEYAAQKYFGTIEEAAEQAGLVYSKSGKIRKDMIERNPEILKVLIRRNRDFIRNIAKRVYWGALGRGFPSIEMEDLFHEAIIAFIETIPKKPPKVGLRRFCYKNIYYRLLNMNKKYVSEKLRHIPFKKIEFMLGEEEFD
ncbi:MAG: sigma-70 family RNA polymerase sigma factor, partial [Candidatus Aenigmarchaeota archaeon]|nr:sigma-70 family RNA polymerase sigma factor [Candidatus Aenigmarchaeota archaeon]